MDWTEYMDDEHAAEVIKLAAGRRVEIPLTSQKAIKAAAVFGGIVGMDRFMLGDIKKGVAKLAAFVAIIVTFIALFAVICAPLAYSLFVPVAAFVVFVGAVAADGVLCVKKNAQNNYYAAVHALKALPLL